MATLGFKASDDKLNDDFDNFNFDDFNFDVPEPKDDRHPVIKTLAPAGRGAKQYITNSSNIEKFVKAAMPRGYGQAYDLYQEGKSEMKQLYNSVGEEIKPVKDTAKSLLRKVLPRLDGKIPKGMKAKLDEMAREEQRWQAREGDGREEQLSSLLASIFEQKATDQERQREEVNERDKLRQGFEQIRHRDQMSQLDAIRIAVEQQAQYQNKIGFNVQKKQLELSYRTLWALVDLNKEQKRSNAEFLTELRGITKNTGLPDYVKITTGERFKELTRNKFLENVREGMFGGAQDYFRKFTRNIKDQVLGRVRDYAGLADSLGSTAEMAAGAAEGMEGMPGFSARDEIISGLMNLPMDWLAERGGRLANKALSKNSRLRRGGNRLSYLTNTFGDRTHEFLNDRSRNWGSLEGLREFLANAAPSNLPDSRMEVDNIARLHEPKPFSRQNSKSLDEIIPGLLARIHREIRVLRTGDENTALITYDYQKNQFTTDKKLGADLRQRIAGKSSERANKYADSILNQIDRGGKLSPEQREHARKMLIEKAVMGESIDISRVGNAQAWGGGENGAAISSAFNRYLRASDGKIAENNNQAYKRQIDLLYRHRGIVGDAGDPRVVLQQMVNAGQLGELRQMGILDENNNVNRKLYAEWLQGGGQMPEPATAPAAPTGGVRSFTRRSGGKVVHQYGDDLVSELRSLTEALKGQAKGGSTVEGNVQTIVQLLSGLDAKYTHASDANFTILQAMLERLSNFGGAGAGSISFGGGGTGAANQPKAYTSLWAHLTDKALSAGASTAGALRSFGKRLQQSGQALWNRLAPVAATGVNKTLQFGKTKIKDLSGKLQGYYGDVVVSGETFPRLRANLLKAGQYRDKATGRIIYSLEDITGDVEDLAGNTVITLDEFYNSYITGSVNRRVKEVFGGLKSKLADWHSQLQEAVPAGIRKVSALASALFEKARDSLPPYDVYVKNDMSKPLLYANLMRYDEYVSARTGKPIRHPRFIDGPVLNSKGWVVVSEDHLREGLVDISGDPIGVPRLLFKGAKKLKQAWDVMREAAVGIFGAVAKGVGNVSEYFKNFFMPFGDMITNSKRTVTLLEEIRDILDTRMPGKKVRGDMDGDGIRDGSIEDIRRKREAAARDGGDEDDTEGASGGRAGLVGKLLAGLGGMFGRNKKREEEDEEEDDEDGFGLSDAADVAEIADALNGDGERGERGSRARRRAAKKRLKRMRRGRGMRARLGGMFSRGGQAARGAGSAALKGGAGRGMMGRAGSAAWNAAKWGVFTTGPLKAAGTVAGLGGRAALATGGGLLAAGGAVAPWLARGLGLLFSAPVSIGLTAGWLGWEAFKYIRKTKLTPLSRLRLAQYGFADDDKDALEKIFTLESKLEGASTIKEDGNLIIDQKQLDLEEIAELFEIGRPEDMKLFNLWYRRRFVPVYGKWLSELRKVKAEGKLGSIESIIPGKEKLRVAQSAVAGCTEAYSHMVGWNQARPKLAYDAQGVQQILEAVQPDLQKEAEKDGGPKAAASAQDGKVTSTTAAASLAAKALTDTANYTVKDEQGNTVDANTMGLGELTEKIKKGALTVTVATTLPATLVHSDKNRLDALASIRYKAYGLTHMSADKVRMLGALELFMGDHLSEDPDSPKLMVGTDAVLQMAGEVFGVPNRSGEHAERWKYWFNGRFLPVFLLWAGALRKKTGKKDLRMASETFAAEDQLPLARAIIGAQGIDKSGAKTSIWNILSNPWADAFELNSDSDTTAGNLEAIRLLADKVRLGEVTAKLPKNRENDETKPAFGWFATGRGSVRRGTDSKGNTIDKRGVGISATGDAITAASTSKDAKPLPGMGDTVSFSGGGGGNYTDLPMPGGVGWSANRELILKAAKMAGVDPRALIATIAVESSFNPNAAPRNPNLPSSAKGLGQHLDSSWLEDLQRDGSKYGIPNGTNQFDARASALMTASRLKFNGAQLQKSLGRGVTVTDLYLAHLMGLGGATKFLKSPQDAIAAEAAPTTAKQHPEYFYDNGKPLTVKQTYEKIAAKLAKRPAEFGVTETDMKADPTAQPSGASTTAAAAPSAAPAQPAGRNNATPPPGGQATVARTAFAPPPAAGSPRLNQPVVMEDGKSAVVGTGPAIVKSKDAKYELILQREESEDDGTYGTLRLPDGTVLNTLELPWRNNENRISCIPPGVYPCKKRPSKTFGEAYEVMQVPGRSAILIHAGNSAGSADKGMKADSQGCILLGMDRGRKGNQKVITASKAAMRLFHEKMQDMPFTLVIRPGKNNLGTSDTKPGVSFDPVRSKPSADAASATPQSTVPAFKPTGPAATAGAPGATPTSDLPRMATTTRGFAPGGPSKADMQARDAAISDTIAPKIDSVVNTLLKSLDVQTSGLAVLKDILTAVQGSASAASEKPSSVSTNKIRPQTDSSVPVPQRRSV